MRTYKEQTERILEKLQQHNAIRRKRKRSVYMAVSLLGCFIFIVVSISLLAEELKNDPFTIDKKNPNKSNVEEYVLENGNDAKENSHKSTIYKDSKVNIYFNELLETSNNQAKLNIVINNEKAIEKQLSLNEVLDILGVDIRPTRIPINMKSYMDVYPDAKFIAYYYNDGAPLYEQFSFSYKEDFDNEEYNPLEKKLQVLASKQELITDYSIVENDTLVKSTINEQELLVGKRKMGYGPYTIVDNGPNVPTGYYDIFVAQFVMDGIHLEVVADNFTEDELIESLVSIIQR